MKRLLKKVECIFFQTHCRIFELKHEPVIFFSYSNMTPFSITKYVIHWMFYYLFILLLFFLVYATNKFNINAREQKKKDFIIQDEKYYEK